LAGPKYSYTIKITDIDTSNRGVAELLKFYAWAKRYTHASIELNISPCNSMDANLSALLLALIHKLKVENKLYVFLLLGDGMNVFFRNGLVSHLKGDSNKNSWGDDRQSTIPLTTFTVDQDDEFCHYLRNDFFRHRGLDGLKLSTKDNLTTQFEEIFTNVGQHAETSYPVFTCGQYFPEKRQLKFSLVDLGIGFLPKIREKTEGQISTDNSAIIWSTLGLNTTKDKAFGPGGTGLKELKSYCAANNGSFHICSGDGYVNFLGDRSFEHTLTHGLPGSMVNIIFRDL
jgi:hypothetical protein